MKWPSLFDYLSIEWRDFIFLDEDLKFLSDFIENQYFVNPNNIYPKKSDIFNAFTLNPLDVKCVILGQDPYHGPNQAHGLSFSVKEEVNTPPSLRNLFKELKNDLGIVIPKHGCLEKWKNQGVFLLNTVLTVERGKPKSHENKGWQTFTTSIIKSLSDKRENLVFMLWGNHAKSYKEYIDKDKHLILEAAHPSPYSANKFFGCKHFSKTNEYLIKYKKKEIDWNL
jgi:uracil-DNA glycosylase